MGPGTGCRGAEIGSAALECLTEQRPPVRHPHQDEWVHERRARLDPVVRAAKVRSWRAFTSSADFVAVNQSGDTVTVTRMLPVAQPRGAFEGDPSKVQELLRPSAEHLGQAILRACDGLRPTST